jgi:hypothetical protein
MMGYLPMRSGIACAWGLVVAGAAIEIGSGDWCRDCRIEDTDRVLGDL